MQSDDLAQLAESMREEADGLWERTEKCNRLPVIQAPNVLDVTGHTVGKLRGWAEVLEWHATHNGGE